MSGYVIQSIKILPSTRLFLLFSLEKKVLCISQFINRKLYFDTI